MPTPTLRDLAKAAGVHYSTVSLALRNHPKLNKETCRRIQEVARKMNYRPNPLVSSLMEYVRTTKSPRYQATLGFIVQAANLALAKKNSDYTYGLCHAHAKLFGYAMDFFCVDGTSMTARKLSEILYARGIQGLVISSDPQARLDLDWDRFSATALGFGQPILHRACCHHFHTAQLALQELRRVGYRRIGLNLHEMADLQADHEHHAAFLIYLDQIEPRYRIPPILTKKWDNAPAFLRWYLKYKPDVILSSEVSVLDWLRQAGISVPEEVGFAILDLQRENPVWSELHGDLAGTDQRKSERMASVVDLTLMQLQRNERGVPRSPRTLMNESLWLSGGTVRKVGPSGSDQPQGA